MCRTEGTSCRGPVWPPSPLALEREALRPKETLRFTFSKETVRCSTLLPSPLRCCPTFLSKEQARPISRLGTKPPGSALGAPTLPTPLDTLSFLSPKPSGSVLGAPTLPTPPDTFLEYVGAADATAAAVGAALVGTAATALVGTVAAASAAHVGTAAAAAAAAAAGGSRGAAASLAAAPLAVALAAAAKAAAIVMATVASGFMTAATALVVAAVASASRLVLATMAAFSASSALLGGTEELKPNSPL